MPYDGSTRPLLTGDVPDTPDWHQYRQAIKELQAVFPGARLCEINLFAYLRNSGDLSSQRFYQVSTNVYDDGVDHWNDFDGNSCFYTGGLQSNIRNYPLKEPAAGDVVLTRNGGTGKAVGVVWRNEYPQAMTTESRIHVIWLNKTETVTPLESFPRIGFSNASGFELTFRKREEYRPTFAALDSVREVDGLNRGAVIRALREFDELCRPQFLERYGSPSRSHWIAFEEKEYDMKPVWRAAFSYMPGGRAREDNPKSNVVKPKLEALGFTVVVRASPPPQRQGVETTDTRIEQPLNQILYGPPGTGKTWHTVNLSLSIVDGHSHNGHDRERFDALAFDPKTGMGNIAMVTFHQNFAYEDFVEGIRPVLSNDEGGLRYELRDGLFKKFSTEACKRGEERFVLIIDEINRGNIARIFGELITLIEPSRRLDRDDATRVTLPYSTDSFGVPKNLYLIGTMNTADRSIQLLDTALRRRFEFVEMMPEPDHEQMGQIEGLNLTRLLQSMNDRIAVLLDREHQIGHTYLLHLEDVETLGDRFRKQIFPLLQEYFFDDWSKIEAVLGRSPFVVSRSVDTDLENLETTDEERTIFKRLSDSDPRWTSVESYRAIYEANPSASGGT